MAKLEDLPHSEYKRIRDDQELRFRGKKPTQKELDHLEVHAHPDGTPDAPAWIVSHVHTGEPEPEMHEFHDVAGFLDHIAEHSGVPDEE